MGTGHGCWMPVQKKKKLFLQFTQRYALSSLYSAAFFESQTNAARRCFNASMTLLRDLPEQYCGFRLRQLRFDAQDFLRLQLAKIRCPATGEPYASVADYDVQLASVIEDMQDELHAVIVVHVIVNAARPIADPTPITRWALHFVVTMHLQSGLLVLRERSTPLLARERRVQTANCLLMAAELRNSIVPVSRAKVHSVSNATVFSRKSLSFLQHPHLPIAIVL